MTKPAIAGRLAADAELDANEVLRIARQILTADPRRLFNPNGTSLRIADLDADTAAAIASLGLNGDGTVRKVSFWSKPKVLELLERCGALAQDDDLVSLNAKGSGNARRH